jgi:hypothetical protein
MTVHNIAATRLPRNTPGIVFPSLAPCTCKYGLRRNAAQAVPRGIIPPNHGWWDNESFCGSESEEAGRG